MNATLPQPPPNAPAPPPSEAALRSRQWWKWIWIVGAVSVIGVFVIGFIMPVVFSASKKSNTVKAVSNAKQIGIALFSFAEDYGTYPSAATIAKVRADHPGVSARMGTATSNDFFRQLIVTECIDHEWAFHAIASGVRKPDGVMTGADMLAKGECGFSYIAGLPFPYSPPQTPVLMTPLVPGKRLFDFKLSRKHYGGKAVILMQDNSVLVPPVDKSGHVHLNGKDLFDPSQPFWNGRTPDVKWPE